MERRQYSRDKKKGKLEHIVNVNDAEKAKRKSFYDEVGRNIDYFFRFN